MEKQEQLAALSSLLADAGLDASDLLTAITTLATAKKAVKEKEEKKVQERML